MPLVILRANGTRDVTVRVRIVRRTRDSRIGELHAVTPLAGLTFCLSSGADTASEEYPGDEHQKDTPD